MKKKKIKKEFQEAVISELVLLLYSNFMNTKMIMMMMVMMRVL